MPLSKDPVRRAKQLDNLRPAGAVKHGATSEGKLAPLRARATQALFSRYQLMVLARPLCQLSRGRQPSYRIIHGDDVIDWLTIAGVYHILTDAGVDLTTLAEVDPDR